MVKKEKVKKEGAKDRAAREGVEAAQAKAEVAFGVSLKDLSSLNEVRSTAPALFRSRHRRRSSRHADTKTQAFHELYIIV